MGPSIALSKTLLPHVMHELNNPEGTEIKLNSIFILNVASSADQSISVSTQVVNPFTFVC